MKTTLRKALIAGGLTAAALVGGGIGGAMLNGVASAQTSTSTPASGDTEPTKTADGPRGPRRATALEGEDLEKAKAAATAAVPDATFDRAFRSHDGSVIRAHLTKADGTHAHVAMNSEFKVTEVREAPKGPHGPRGKGRGTPLEGDARERAKAAALEAVPGAAFQGARQAPNGTIHALVVKTDGTRVHVVMDKDYNVTDVHDMHRHGPRHRGPRPAASSEA